MDTGPLDLRIARAADSAVASGRLTPGTRLREPRNAVMRATNILNRQQRRFNRILLAALRDVRVLLVTDEVQSGQRIGGIEDGLTLLESRIVRLERRAASQETMLATMAVEVAALGKLIEDLKRGMPEPEAPATSMVASARPTDPASDHGP